MGIFIELTQERIDELNKMTPEEQYAAGEKAGEAFLDAFCRALDGEDVELPEHIARVRATP